MYRLHRFDLSGNVLTCVHGSLCIQAVGAALIGLSTQSDSDWLLRQTTRAHRSAVKSQESPRQTAAVSHGRGATEQSKHSLNDYIILALFPITEEILLRQANLPCKHKIREMCKGLFGSFRC